MPTAQPRKRTPTRMRLRLPGILLLLAALSTILGGTLSLRLGPGWYYHLRPLCPRGIVVHHSATPAQVRGRRVDAEFLDEVHATRDWGIRYGQHVYHIGYHYVILPDGTVEPGRPEWMPGAHTVGFNNYLGICLVGDFAEHNGHTAHPTRAQQDALVELSAAKMVQYHLPPARLYRHGDLDATECPGAGGPWDEIVARVKARRGR